jgi:sulfite reductase (NADPH) hemoprotein beta-component
LASVGLSTPNAGAISDIIACPGLDYCALATARSIPVAQRIAERFGDGQRAKEIGPLKIKISGCINACGHHHVGHIGILGLERAGEETYQITLGGSADEQAAIGQITGPGFSSENVVEAIETIVETYSGLRLSEQETFIDAYRRVGMAPFKEALYERSAGSDI